MAPEEILGSADASRRNFLKKVLAGTTFAAPVIASFSMEGLSPGNALAQTLSCANQSQTGPIFTSNQSFCANMPTSPCCTFAAEITVNIWSLGTNFIPGSRIIKFPFFEPTVEVQALFLGQMAEALEAMAKGIEKGKGDCAKKPARDEFKKAGKELGKLQTLVASVCQGPFADDLIDAIDCVIGQVNELVSGHCGPA